MLEQLKEAIANELVDNRFDYLASGEVNNFHIRAAGLKLGWKEGEWHFNKNYSIWIDGWINEEGATLEGEILLDEVYALV